MRFHADSLCVWVSSKSKNIYLTISGEKGRTFYLLLLTALGFGTTMIPHMEEMDESSVDFSHDKCKSIRYRCLISSTNPFVWKKR